MTVKYHVMKGDKLDERHELNDDASLLAFLDGNDAVEGEFFASEYKDLKIKYNTHTGVVSVVPALTTHNVTLLYSPKSFNAVTTPLKNVIDLRNRRDFLLALCKLDVTKISSIIKKHIDEEGNFTRKLTLHDVDGTLLRIYHRANRLANSVLFFLLKPFNQSAEHAVYKILSGKEIINIRTKEEAENLINQLKENLVQIREENKSDNDQNKKTRQRQ